jgi:hypothetical protein
MDYLANRKYQVIEWPPRAPIKAQLKIFLDENAIKPPKRLTVICDTIEDLVALNLFLMSWNI